MNKEDKVVSSLGTGLCSCVGNRGLNICQKDIVLSLLHLSGEQHQVLAGPPPTQEPLLITKIFLHELTLRERLTLI